MQTQEPSLKDTTNETNSKSLPDKCVGIYGLRNKTTDKWYVGLSINIRKRWGKYRNLQCKKQPKLHAALLQYGYEGFDKILLEEVSDVEQLKHREVWWMRNKNSVADGYNVSESGTPITEVMRKKISNAITGRKYTIEHRTKMSIAHKGIPRTEEAKRNISMARMGVSTITEDGRRRIREANALRRTPLRPTHL